MKGFLTIQSISLLLFCLGGIPSIIAAPDPQREKQLADSAINTVAKIVPQWLESNEGRFLALYDKSLTGQTLGAAILLPPLGAHPNWPGVMKQLRTLLPRYGWSTIAIQLPVMGNNSDISDYATTLTTATARINAAVAFMHNKGIRNIAIIGHELGATTGAAYLAANEDAQIQAFIGISMSGYSHLGGWLYSPNSIATLALPILDIYAGQDAYHVTSSADARANAARLSSINTPKRFMSSAFQQSATAESVQTRRAGYIAYRRIIISGTDRHFSGAEKQLVKRIIGWLKQHAGGITLNLRKKTTDY